MPRHVLRFGFVVSTFIALEGCAETPASSSGGAGGRAATASGVTSATSVTGSAVTNGSSSSGSAGAGGIWSPTPLTSWQWQLSGTLDTSIDVAVYDIDLFDTSDTDLATLKAAGRRVICYFSAGSYEPGRPDSNQFAQADFGNVLDGWPDEKWLDTRSTAVRTIMKARLDTAHVRGCDGVEPDNVDAYENNPGFPLTAQTQLDYNQFIATEAHARGLSVGLKNDLDQATDLVMSFDWALNEQCFMYEECDVYQGTFLAANKAVFHAEYLDASQLDAVCAVTKPLGLSTILKNLSLDAYRLPCP